MILSIFESRQDKLTEWLFCALVRLLINFKIGGVDHLLEPREIFCLLVTEFMAMKQKMAAMHFSTTLTKDRNRVKLLMLSKAFQALAFFMGLPDQMERIVRIHRMSMIMVPTARATIYQQTVS